MPPRSSDCSILRWARHSTTFARRNTVGVPGSPTDIRLLCALQISLRRMHRVATHTLFDIYESVGVRSKNRVISSVRRMVLRASDLYLVLKAYVLAQCACGGRRNCGISEGGAGDDDGHADLHVRLPRCRGECAGRNDHGRNASLKRGHVVSNRCRHPHPFDLTE